MNIHFKKRQKKLRIAIIADEHTVAGLEPEAELIHLTPGNWRWCLKFHKTPDILMVESAWRGHRASWKGKIVDYGNDNTLESLVSWCRKKHIPTVFWNKEDPVCNNRFMQAAKLFDAVYTTDADSLNNYQRLADTTFHHTGILQFAAQPAIHYPGDFQNRLSGIAFAGGYYGDEYPQRSKQQTEILSALKELPLTIYDRFWQQEKLSNFPAGLDRFCKPAVPLKEMGNVYRRHQVYLNFNTVTNSSTMLSRRVLELAACGSPMVSTPSPALKALFDDLVPQVLNGEQAHYQCQQLLNNHELRKKTSRRLHEQVMEQHTWQHRLKQISDDTGYF